MIKEVIAFFTASSKRNEVLKQMFGGQLSGFCETRWVERHESVQQFRSSLPKIVETLDNIAHWRERQSASRAATLLAAVSDSHFIIALVVLNDFLAHTYPLSKVFQKPSIDVKTAQDAVQDTLTVLQGKRRLSESGSSNIFNEATAPAEEIGTDLRLKRAPKRQACSQNMSTSDVATYFRETAYRPLLDKFIADIIQRFPSETLDIFQLFS